ncbi:MAG: FHA domain-containing protein [Thermoanaerobaculia bacterium]
MVPSLFGLLDSFPAVEVVRFLVARAMSGTLSIASGGGFEIVFRRGRIVAASCRGENAASAAAEIAIRAMLQWTGTFSFADSIGDPAGSVDLDPAQLIATVEERIDQSVHYPAGSVFLLARDIETDERFTAGEVRVLRELDGTRPIEEVIRESGLASDEAAAIVASMVRRGWLISRQGSKMKLPAARPSDSPAPDRAGVPRPPTEEMPAPAGSAGPAEPSSRAPFLACFTLDNTASTSFPLFDESCTIGRSSRNTIQLDDPSVSSSHARITATADGHLLEDLGSSNGTFVNGRKIRTASLRDKDRIRMGAVYMVYMIPEVHRPESEPRP